MDPRAIAPFNDWWRKSQHCEPQLQVIYAFSAGFRAGLQRGLDEAKALITGKPLTQGKKG